MAGPGTGLVGVEMMPKGMLWTEKGESSSISSQEPILSKFLLKHSVYPLHIAHEDREKPVHGWG